MNPSAGEHLNQYVTERLPLLVQGYFETEEDIPSFTLDRHYVPLKDPRYGG